MKALHFVGDSVAQVRELDQPTPGSGEVLLQMKASGICGSDLGIFRESKSLKTGDLSSIIPGHEPVGVVAKLGQGVKDLTIGDRVMMHHYTGCLRCSMCRIGYTQMCLKLSLIHN